MHFCALCGKDFPLTRVTRRYCSTLCEQKAWDRRKRAEAKAGQPKLVIKCNNCKTEFAATVHNRIYCSTKCCQKVMGLAKYTRVFAEKAKSGLLHINRSHSWRAPYTLKEISSLRADPLCVLPNRTLRSQWKKCLQLEIRRDVSLRSVYEAPAEAKARYNKAGKTPESKRRAALRRRARKQPELILDELRKLARGHPLAEDIVIEGFATLLRLAVSPAEAFKLARTEVNRTSAQPFRDQSFDPEIDYEARETGRQVGRSSNIRAANGDG